MGRTLPLIVIPLLIVVSIFVPRTLAFLPAVFALAAYLFYAFQNKEILFADKYISLFLGLIACLSFASFLWAEFPQNALDRSYSTAGILFSGFILLAVASHVPKVEEWPLKRLAMITAALLSALGLFFFAENALFFPIGHAALGDEFASSMWNRSLVVFAMLYAPALYLLHKALGMGRPFAVSAGLLTLCMGAGLWMAQSQSAQIMFLIAFLAYFASFFLRRILLIITAVAVIALTLSAPLIPKVLEQKFAGAQGDFITSASLPHRIEVWNFVAEKIHDRPLLGYGVESVRSMKSAQVMPHIKSDSILHPHNAFLQVWVETGALGALLTCALLLFILFRISRSSRQDEPLYYAVFISSLSLLATGYGLWQSWQMGLLLAVSAACILFARISPPVKA